MAKQYVLGIDPGFTGALAVIDTDSRFIEAIFDMPVVQPLKIAGGPDSRESKVVLDLKRLADTIKRYAPAIRLAVLERVHAMPDQGVSSMFRFGEGYGCLQGILAANEIKVLMPPPAVWKAALGLTHRKDDSLILASNIFGPTAANRYFTRKKDNGRAEAALLALFGHSPK